MLYKAYLSRAVISYTYLRDTYKVLLVTETEGTTLSSGDAQEAAIRKAFKKAGLGNFDETSYVEYYGLGRLWATLYYVEVGALSRVFRRNSVKNLYIESVRL